MGVLGDIPQHASRLARDLPPRRGTGRARVGADIAPSSRSAGVRSQASSRSSIAASAAPLSRAACAASASASATTSSGPRRQARGVARAPPGRRHARQARGGPRGEGLRSRAIDGHREQRMGEEHAALVIDSYDAGCLGPRDRISIEHSSVGCGSAEATSSARRVARGQATKPAGDQLGRGRPERGEGRTRVPGRSCSTSARGELEREERVVRTRSRSIRTSVGRGNVWPSSSLRISWSAARLSGDSRARRAHSSATVRLAGPSSRTVPRNPTGSDESRRIANSITCLEDVSSHCKSSTATRTGLAEESR